MVPHDYYWVRIVHSPATLICLMFCPRPCIFTTCSWCNKASGQTWHVPCTKSHWICCGSCAIANMDLLWSTQFKIKYIQIISAKRLLNILKQANKGSAIKDKTWDESLILLYCEMPLMSTIPILLCPTYTEQFWHLDILTSDASTSLFRSRIMGLKSQRQKEARKEPSGSFVLSYRLFGWQGCVTN